MGNLSIMKRKKRASKLERPPFYEVQRRFEGQSSSTVRERESQAMLIVTDSESNSSTAGRSGLERLTYLYLPLRISLRMDSFIILSER